MRKRFSWPAESLSLEGEGTELVAEGGMLCRARLEGLLGEVRFRRLDLAEGLPLVDDLADRRDSFTLGRKGVASCGCDCPPRIEFVLGAGALLGVPKNCCDAMRRSEGDAGEGEFRDWVEATDTSEL